MVVKGAAAATAVGCFMCARYNAGKNLSIMRNKLSKNHKVYGNTNWHQCYNNSPKTDYLLTRNEYHKHLFC